MREDFLAFRKKALTETLVLLADCRPEQARRVLEEKATEGPDRIGATIHLAWLLQELGEYPDSLRLLNRVEDWGNRNAEHFFLSSRCHLFLGEWRKALESAAEAERFGKADVDLLVLRARALSRLGLHEEARQELDRAMAMEPDSMEVHFWMGRILAVRSICTRGPLGWWRRWKLPRWADQDTLLYAEAVADGDTGPRAERLADFWNSRLFQVPQAFHLLVPLCNRILEHRKDSLIAQKILVQRLYEAQAFRKTLEAVEAASEAFPDEILFPLLGANSAFALGDPEKAARWYKAALAKAPDSPEVLANAAVFHLEQDRAEEAAPLVDRLEIARGGSATAAFLKAALASHRIKATFHPERVLCRVAGEEWGQIQESGNPSRCPLCGAESASPRVMARHPDRRLIRCDTCSLVFADPMPQPEDLRSLYQSEFLTDLRRYSEESLRAHERDPDAEPFNLRLLLQIARLGLDLSRAERGRVLDVGFGVGQLLMDLRMLGYEPHGVDLSADTVRFLQDKGYPVRCSTLEEARYPENNFRIVFMKHLLEHLSDPVSVVREAWRILEPGGYLVVNSPCAESLPQILMGEAWFQSEEHLLAFTPLSFRTLLEQNGFIWVDSLRYVGAPTHESPRGPWTEKRIAWPWRERMDREGSGDVMVILARKERRSTADEEAVS